MGEAGGCGHDWWMSGLVWWVWSAVSRRTGEWVGEHGGCGVQPPRRGSSCCIRKQVSGCGAGAVAMWG